MKKLLYTFCLLLTLQLCCIGQKMPIGVLVERYDITSKPYYCLKGTLKRYTGIVSGYVIPRQTNIGCVETVASFLQSYCLDNSVTKDFNYWDVPIFLEGSMVKGKEVGQWKLLDMNGQKVAFLYFDSLKNIKYEIFFENSLVYRGYTNSKLKKRRKSNNRFKKNDFISF